MGERMIVSRFGLLAQQLHQALALLLCGQAHRVTGIWRRADRVPFRWYGSNVAILLRIRAISIRPAQPLLMRRINIEIEIENSIEINDN
jgi:hypothetical protein